jgi:hypothetical protein
MYKLFSMQLTQRTTLGNLLDNLEMLDRSRLSPADAAVAQLNGIVGMWVTEL